MLSEKIEKELYRSLRSYVIGSWYNHWSSIVIEDVFRDHASVLPAVGLIKKVDFFVGGTPFDLKVTGFPEGYVKHQRRAAGLRPELTLLKQFARGNGVMIPTDLPDGKLLEHLWKKIADLPNEDAVALISGLREKRLELIQEAMADPKPLMTWLYENQGVRRFDASNRLFLILVDTASFFASWKLKRARPLLVDRIHTHLDGLGTSPGHKLTFEWEGRDYEAIADIVFVAHETQ